MNKLVLGFALIMCSNAFAIRDCIQYPIRDNKIEMYNGVISDVDSETVYGHCPRSVLVNEKWIAPLVLLGNDIAEGVCIYRLNTATFACKH